MYMSENVMRRYKTTIVQTSQVWTSCCAAFPFQSSTLLYRSNPAHAHQLISKPAKCGPPAVLRFLFGPPLSSTEGTLLMPIS